MIGRMSLRLRLLAAVGAIALLALAVADVVVYASLHSYLLKQTDSALLVSHNAVEDAINKAASQSGDLSQATFCSLGRETAPGMFIEVRTSDNAIVNSETCPAYEPGSEQFSPKLPGVISGFTASSADPHEATTFFTVGSTKSTGPFFRVFASKLADGGQLIVAQPIGNIANTLGQLRLLEILVTVGALAGSVLLGLWLVRIGLRPLRDVVKTAESISGGDLLHRVPNANPDTEVGQVATALNVMLERIESDFRELQSSEDRLRQFVSDASHELRTPIAAVSGYAQLFSQGAAQRPEDLERVMQGIERESGRMGRLVNDLLTLARFDDGQAFEREPVELVGLVAEAVETARVVGPEWPIQFDAREPVEVLADRDALRQVFDNLLANARAHTAPGTAVHVRVGSENGEAFVEVADEGPGITEEQAKRVFERFFRADPSRSRHTGGSGLGLAIVATIMHAHDGAAKAEPGPRGGARFTVTLPVFDLGDDGAG